MAKKGGLGTGVDTLLKGSTRQRNRQLQQASSTTELETQPVVETAVAPKTTEAANTVHAIDRSSVEIDASSAVAKANDANGEAGDQLLQLSLDQIRPGSYQPRRSFDQTALQELADSLVSQGLVQPILVRPYGGRYELIAGSVAGAQPNSRA